MIIVWLPKVHHRYSAAGIHFLSSLSVVALLVGILLFFWFPDPYFSASGGWQGLRLVAGVDLVLGPLLTFIVFNPQKKVHELVVDLGIIVLIQISALVWGIRAIYEQRPVAVVYLDTSFYTVPAKALQVQGIAPDSLEIFGDSRPVFVMSRQPATTEEWQRFETLMTEEQIPPHEQVWLYQPLAEHFSEIVGSTLDVDVVMEGNPDMRREIERVLGEIGAEKDALVYLALTSRYRNVLLIFDKQGTLKGTVNAPYKTGEV